MVRSFFAAPAVLAAAMLAVSVDAHTNMAVPKVQFPDGFYNGNSPYGRINGDAFSSASSIPSYQGVQKIAKVMEGYKTLRQLIMTNVNISTISGQTGNKECGLTVTTGDKQPIPDAIDFPWGHPGPCEAWCDNTRIFFNADCQGNSVGKIPVDKAKCKGVSIIQAMYVGVHVSNWEVYANCAPMEGGTKSDPATLFDDSASGSGASSGGATSSGSTGGDADSKSGGSSNATPSLTPAATSSGSANSAGSSSGSSTPVPTTTTPTTTAPATTAPATTAPAAASSGSSGKSKCKRRARD